MERNLPTRTGNARGYFHSHSMKVFCTLLQNIMRLVTCPPNSERVFQVVLLYYRNYAHCPVWESRGPEGIRKFRILRGALKIVSMLWIYHLIHGIKIFCFKHFLIYCLPIMSIHSEGWRQENQIVARRRNSFEYKLWLNLKSDILMSNFQLFFLKNIE